MFVASGFVLHCTELGGSSSPPYTLAPSLAAFSIVLPIPSLLGFAPQH